MAKVVNFSRNCIDFEQSSRDSAPVNESIRASLSKSLSRLFLRVTVLPRFVLWLHYTVAPE